MHVPRLRLVVTHSPSFLPSPPPSLSQAEAREHVVAAGAARPLFQERPRADFPRERLAMDE